MVSDGIVDYGNPDMDGFKDFQYDTLRPGRSSIRLIRVHQDLYHGFMRCDIRTANLDEPYTALSYTWGTTADNRLILINGDLFEVRRNLWDFLDLARLYHSNAWFWIDALCINQQDIEERNDQVSRMAITYTGAARLIIWLGPFDDTNRSPNEAEDDGHQVELRNAESEFGYDWKIWEKSRTGSIQLQPPPLLEIGPLWNLVDSILSHPYWCRAWVVQEIFSSEEIDVIYPPFKVRWKFLVFCVGQLFGRDIPDLPIYLRLAAQTDILSSAISRQHQTMWQKLVGRMPQDQSRAKVVDLGDYLANDMFPQAVSHLTLKKLEARHHDGLAVHLCLKRRAREDLVNNKQDFARLVTQFSKSDCVDRRDKLYGLTSLCTGDNTLLVDYSEDVYDLYFRACEHFYYRPNVHNFSDVVANVDGLLFPLNLGPLDLVFGDRKARSSFYASIYDPQLAKDACNALGNWIDPQPGKLLLQHQRNNTIAQGRCGRCQVRLRFKLSNVEPKSAFVVHCHAGSETLTPAGRDHVLNHFVVFETNDGNSRRINSCGVSAAAPAKMPLLVTDYEPEPPLEVLIKLLSLHEAFYDEYDQSSALLKGSPSFQPARLSSHETVNHHTRARHRQHKGSMLQYLREAERVGFTGTQYYTRAMLEAVYLEAVAQQYFARALIALGFQCDIDSEEAVE